MDTEREREREREGGGWSIKQECVHIKASRLILYWYGCDDAVVISTRINVLTIGSRSYNMIVMNSRTSCFYHVMKEMKRGHSCQDNIWLHKIFMIPAGDWLNKTVIYGHSSRL